MKKIIIALAIILTPLTALAAITYTEDVFFSSGASIAPILKSPNGTRYKLSVGDYGDLYTEPMP